MEQFQPVLDRLVSELGAAVTFLSVGVRRLARNSRCLGKMRSALFSVVLGVVATLVCGNVSAQPADDLTILFEGVSDLGDTVRANSDDADISIDVSRSSSASEQPYLQVTGTGGRAPYRYVSISSDPDLTGIAIDANGLIGVTPSVAGDFTITVNVDDDAGAVEALVFTMHVINPLEIAPIGPRAAWDGRAITPIEVTVSGGRGPYTYLPLRGEPSGVSIDSLSGQITGTPTEESGFFTVTVTVEDDGARFAKRNFDMSVYSTRLAEKFKPILILDSRDNDQRPKQVEILGAHVGQDSSGRDLWKSIYYEVRAVSEPRIVADVRATEIAAYRIEGVPVGYVPGVDTTTANFSMLRNRYGETTDTAVYHLYPHFDFGGPGVDGSGHDGGTLPTWESVYNDHKDVYGDRIYAHIFEENDKTVIQYWFFYPYNDWWNNHEGDWEHINVVVSSLDPQQAVAEAVEYYFHHDYIRRVVVEPDTSGTSDNPLIGLQGLEGVDNSVALIKGRRPVVYVGGWGEGLGGSGPGGHGSYPCHGPWYLVADLEFLGVPLGEGAKYDNPDGKGSILYDVPLTVLANASEYDYDVNPEMSWLKANLRFGHRYVDSPPLTRGDGNAAPEGPSYKETWRRTGMAGKDEYTFVNTTRLNFQHHFIKEDTRWSGDVLLIGDIVIDPGATLTIAPGTVITSDVGQDLHGMNDAARVDIVNYGEMTADASKGDSIVFRSNASVPSPGDWYGIRNYGVLTMKNCVIRDSRGSVEGYGTQTLENVRFVNNDTLSVPLITNIVASQNVAIKPKQVSASGGRRPYTYSLSGTSDLSISESGLITGIPTQTGTFTDTVTVTTAADETDLTSDSVMRSFTMTVYPQLIVKLISNSDTTATTLFIDATVDTSITPIQVYASGGKPPYQYSLSGDDVTNIAIDSPGGLTISNHWSHHGRTHTAWDSRLYGDRDGFEWHSSFDVVRPGCVCDTVTETCTAAVDHLGDIGCGRCDSGCGHRLHTRIRIRRSDAV